MKICVPLALACLGIAGQDEVVFRSDTTLVRVDVQVLDRDNRAISRLEREAFALREQGQQRAIKNFVREEMPIDLLFLIDVSGSMRPHVKRMATAAHQALPSLRKDDRVAVMAFDRQSRLRMPFRSGPAEAQREFDNLLRSETFNGGTDITRALFDGAQFMKRQGRKEARRAIVLLTDDQTEFEADEERVAKALIDADTAMSVLLAPNVVQRGVGGGGYPRGGRRGPGGPVGGGSRTRPAGSAEIARETGGDSLQANAASALETTLNRLRQRYALYFNLPAGVTAGDSRTVNVALEESVRRQYPDATLRYRRTYTATISSGSGAPSEEALETVPLLPGPKPPVSRRRTTDESSSNRPSIVVH